MGIDARGASRLLLAALTGALLALAFPDPGLGWLAWVALVPLLEARRGLGSPASAGLGLLAGLVAAYALYHWILGVGEFGWLHGLVLAVYMALYPAAWCAGVALAGRSRVPVLLSAPALWVVLDYVKAHAGFLAISWTTLAQSQHETLPILQLAAVTGGYGVTFLVVLGNVAVFQLLRREAPVQAAAALALIGAVYLGGLVSLQRQPPGTPLEVAIVQPGILVSERRSPAGLAAGLERLERLTREAAQGADLVVWPETALPDPVRSPGARERVRALVETTATPVLFGASEVWKLEYEAPGVVGGERQLFNSAYLMRPGQPLADPYRKIRLLPFGEYTPLRERMSWPGWLVPEIVELTPGGRPGLFDLPGGVTVGVLICWENLFAGMSRELVRGGARMLVQVTNDNWFGDSAQPRQHNLASVLRAVENGVPVLIASNTGPSAVIDARGRVIAELPALFARGVVRAGVTVTAGSTLYTRFGDLFVAGAGLLLVGAAGLRRGRGR